MQHFSTVKSLIAGLAHSSRLRRFLLHRRFPTNYKLLIDYFCSLVFKFFVKIPLVKLEARKFSKDTQTITWEVSNDDHWLQFSLECASFGFISK